MVPDDCVVVFVFNFERKPQSFAGDVAASASVLGGGVAAGLMIKTHVSFG